VGGAESNREVLDYFHFTGFNGHKHIEVALGGKWILPVKK
jgi:hypothetical protein